MLSPQSVPDPRYGALVNTEASRNFFMGQSNDVSDDENIVIGKFSAEDFIPQMFGMEVIIKARNPFQVFSTVVGLAEVDVIDFGKAKRIWNESAGYKSMNLDVLVERGVPQIDGKIASGSSVRSQYATDKDTFPSGLSPSDLIETSDSSEVADFVEVPKFGDRNWSPFFCDFGIHAAGLPSGSNGLEIKNPSRGATLGGLAFTSTVSRRHQMMGG